MIPLDPWVGEILAAVAHVVLAMVVSAHIVLTKQDVRGAIGWVGLVWFTPVVGAALYGLFGINRIRRQAGRMLLIETSSKRSYAPTIRFYQRAGYHEISRIKDFYRIEDDKVVFCKQLTPS